MNRHAPQVQPIYVDANLYYEANNILRNRGSDLETYIQLQLRALVSANKRYAPLTLQDHMPYGKFKGENVEVVIRAEPRYIAWLVTESDTFSLDEHARILLHTVLETLD